MANKPKAIASTDEPIDIPAPEVSEDLAHDPTIAPLLQPPVAGENGHLLRSAREQMEAELTQLQTTLDSLSEDYADRAETMVKDWLTQCRGKAKQRINAIDLTDFFGNGDERSPIRPSPSLSPAVEVEVTAC
jgi:hypothetical protein